MPRAVASDDLVVLSPWDFANVSDMADRRALRIGRRRSRVVVRIVRLLSRSTEGMSVAGWVFHGWGRDGHAAEIAMLVGQEESVGELFAGVGLGRAACLDILRLDDLRLICICCFREFDRTVGDDRMDTAGQSIRSRGRSTLSG